MSREGIALGKDGEERAARFFIEAGCEVLARGFKTRLGEIDLVVRDGATVVFVEVKTRRGDRFGPPEEAVGPRKQAHMAKAALLYARSRRLGDVPMRFDVISISREGIRHIRDAFRAPSFTW